MKPSTHIHPNPLLKRLIDYGAIITVGILWIGAILFLFLPLAGAPSGFLLAPIFVILLSTPVLMLTAYTPAVTVDETGITLLPSVWKQRHINWDAIEAIKVYPLLPSEESEVTRRFAVGKRNYRPAAGIMLVIPELPAQYRIAGFFAGVGSKPIIALTNRAHTDYDTLVQKVIRATAPAIHAEDLLEDA